MDNRTLVVELVRALAWPVTVLVGIAVVRKPVIALLGSLRRFKYGEAEAEFQEGLDELRQQVSGAAPLVIGYEPPEAGVSTHEAPSDIESPELAILNAWAGAERIVFSLGEKAGVHGRSLPEVLRRLQEKGHITNGEFDSVNGLRALRNLVAHRTEPSVSREKAAQYLAMADAVTMLLEQKLRRP